MLNETFKHRWSMQQANSRHIQPSFDKDFLEKTEKKTTAWVADPREGLPSLDELMSLQTYSPFTQNQFALFLQQHNAESNLSFLIALDRHEALWRAYVQALDRHCRHRLSGYLGSGHTSPALPSWTRTDLIQHASEFYQTHGPQTHLTAAHRHTLHTLLLDHQRPEPVIFASAKEHLMDVLRKFYYPLFVHHVLQHNLSTRSSYFLFPLALFFLTSAFALELALIFLASEHSRWIALVPFFLGWSLFLASIDRFAWWLVLFNQSEISKGHLCQLQDKTVKRIHQKKAFYSILGVAFLTFITTLSFAFIPPHRI